MARREEEAFSAVDAFMIEECYAEERRSCAVGNNVTREPVAVVWHEATLLVRQGTVS